ncbi:hypothetical protein [Fusobacterium sp. PH5-44]|uniref:hypothetical protein n=1 Tax=unclassified Fusobacterium TaxID=2648384 RepID=UPI003D1A164E
MNWGEFKIDNYKVNENNEILISYSKVGSIVLILFGIIGITFFIFMMILYTKDSAEVMIPILYIILFVTCMFNGITSYGKLALILGEETLEINKIVIPWNKIKRFDFNGKISKVYFLKKINGKSYIEDYKIPLYELDMSSEDIQELLMKFYLENRKIILDKDFYR